MRQLSKREKAVADFLEFIDLDYALLHITKTGLDKGYTDATSDFRAFLKRTGIHDYATQGSGTQHIRYTDAFGLVRGEPELVKLSFQRPATKGGRMYRVSMLGSLRRPLKIRENDLLLFAVRDNQLNITNLTELADRVEAEDPARPKSTNKGATILTIAKSKVLHVLEAIPECEPGSTLGAKVTDLTELSGMALQSHSGALVNALLEELRYEGRIEIAAQNPRRYRLCP